MINAINKFFANKSLKDIVSYLIYFLVFMMFPYIFDFYELLKGEDSDNEYRPRQPPTKKPIPKKQPAKKLRSATNAIRRILQHPVEP
jgi:hypothetical protein